ncbi:hypothetical protein X474_21230 [Dethiosulfatarculus sandiegensis]|uniref:Uncharacterized protein n=1 Tax=Dethiosulfatarculus sandiegensis TaxID=1429043 RepID=A0A0D2J8L0_9BACT|nr:hypothetical protein X474_21230 [Dethiosulfatarculus sandiegensis]
MCLFWLPAEQLGHRRPLEDESIGKCIKYLLLWARFCLKFFLPKHTVGKVLILFL